MNYTIILVLSGKDFSIPNFLTEPGNKQLKIKSIFFFFNWSLADF